MKKFLLKIVYFLLPFVILVYPLDYSLSYFLSKSNEYAGEFEVMNDIYNSKANCDVAIYGSSRAWVHIDPKILSDTLNCSSYNFGIDGHNFGIQYLRHLELLKYNKNPKIIILSLDIFGLQKKDELYEPDQFLPYMLWNRTIEKYTSSFVGYNKYDYFLPVIRYSGKKQAWKTILNVFENSNTTIPCRKNGFLGIEKQWNKDFENASAKQKSYNVILDTSITKLLEDFIKECKTLRIELVLVYTPEYIDGQRFVSNRDSVMNVYDNLSKKYNLKFYNYSSDSICFNKTFFYNASHLNKTGAEIFTRKLASTLKNAHVLNKF